MVPEDEFTASSTGAEPAVASQIEVSRELWMLRCLFSDAAKPPYQRIRLPLSVSLKVQMVLTPIILFGSETERRQSCTGSEKEGLHLCFCLNRLQTPADQHRAIKHLQSNSRTDKDEHKHKLNTCTSKKEPQSSSRVWICGSTSLNLKAPDQKRAVALI